MVEAAPLQEEGLLFHPETNKFHVLNRTGSFLWECLAHPHTVEQLVVKLRESFEGVILQDAARDIQSMIQQMQSLELVVTVPLPTKET